MIHVFSRTRSSSASLHLWQASVQRYSRSVDDRQKESDNYSLPGSPSWLQNALSCQSVSRCRM
jgi:hypothetical protein